jgi:membrane-associated phospholipid phosphatase
MQHRLRGLPPWLAALLLCAISVAVSIACVDRPLARYVHRFDGTDALSGVSHLPGWAIPSGIVVFALVAIAFAAGYRNVFTDFALRCGLAIIAGSALKDALKFLFGRTWPERWLQGNPSYIADGVYGFWPMHGSAGYEAFPSGHTTVGVAALTLVWLRWPRLRLLCTLAGTGLIALLVGGDFHWLSDTIAGGFLGATVGWVAFVIGKRERGAPAPARFGIGIATEDQVAADN